jgi:hypothetical protein
MYTTNQVADYFASDSYDGDTNDRLGLVSYASMPPDAPTESGELSDNDSDPDNDAHGHLSTIANTCYPYSMSATAALFKAWRDYWDTYPPRTEVEITEHPEVHDGWRAGNVLVKLTGNDDSAGMAVHDSGFYKLELQLPGEDWHQHVNIAFWLFSVTAEGIAAIPYKSTDYFGNVEHTKWLTIKIDRTPPVVTILSPTAHGLYSTDDSLTIDYEASDTPSGIYDLSAQIDGVPVTDGQLLTDMMGGHHTITVTAVDFAGNTTTQSADFAVIVSVPTASATGLVGLVVLLSAVGWLALRQRGLQ